MNAWELKLHLNSIILLPQGISDFSLENQDFLVLAFLHSVKAP